MFKKISHTAYPPNQVKLIWDGHCGFCRFWKTRWQLKTKDNIAYATYQDAANSFPDIPLKEFKKASRLIEPDGKIYSGPDSAYRTLWHSGTPFWHELYQNNSWFAWLSDQGYNHISKNRPFYYSLTQLLFGKNPQKISWNWLYLLMSIFLMSSLLMLL